MVNMTQGIFDRVQLEGDPKLVDLYWVDRKFINFGFRAHPEMRTGMCVASLFKQHCETTNIWSHILAFIYFCVLFCLMLARPDGDPDSQNPFKAYKTTTSAWLSRIGCISIILCMGVSAFYHTFNSMSKDWNETLLRFDLVFVGLMILTLTNCLTFVAYSNYPTARLVACILLGVVQVLLFAINMIPQFSAKENENLRRALYIIVLVLAVLLALVWLCWLATGEEIRSFLGWVVLSLMWLCLGMFFYACKYPERLF
jgi:predicted membrane channel-forming protein YqfA (hemolysin III family)